MWCRERIRCAWARTHVGTGTERLWIPSAGYVSRESVLLSSRAAGERSFFDAHAEVMTAAHMLVHMTIRR